MVGLVHQTTFSQLALAFVASLSDCCHTYRENGDSVENYCRSTNNLPCVQCLLFPLVVVVYVLVGLLASQLFNCCTAIIVSTLARERGIIISLGRRWHTHDFPFILFCLRQGQTSLFCSSSSIIMVRGQFNHLHGKLWWQC